MSAPQNIPDRTQDRGDHLTAGYCALHDAHYRLKQGDEVCPQCERWQAQDLQWRDEEDANYTAGDDLGDTDEE